MTLSNNPFPSNEPGREPDRVFHNIDSPFIPEPPRANHHKLLLDRYLQNCRRGFVGENQLVAGKEGDFETKMIFGKLEEAYRRMVDERLTSWGMKPIAGQLTARFLDPVVAVGKAGREYHLYADFVDTEGRCFFPDLDGAQVLRAGPAAMQVYAVENDKQGLVLGVVRLISPPAFKEAVASLIASPFEQIRRNPRGHVALGWVMNAVVSHRAEGAPEQLNKRGVQPDVLALSDITNFTWNGSRSPIGFSFDLPGASYKIEVCLNYKTRQPSVFVKELFW